VYFFEHKIDKDSVEAKTFGIFCIFGRPFIKWFAGWPLSCLSVCPDCNVIVAKWLDGSTQKTGMQVGLGPRSHYVRWGLSSPKLSAHVPCGQMAGWIKMPLSTEVRLGPGDTTLLNGDPARPKKGSQPPIFDPRLFWVNGSTHQDTTG